MDTALPLLRTLAHEARSCSSVGLFLRVAERVVDNVTKRRDIP